MLRRLAWAALLAATVSACDSGPLTSKISDFSTALAASNAAAKTAFQQMNANERNYYLKMSVLNRTPIYGKDKSGPTPLVNTFSDESLKARYDVLALLNDYAQKLAALATNDGPAKSLANIQTIGTNLGTLDKTFQQLAGAKDPAASAYIAPIATVIGWVTQEILEEKREEAIKSAIKEAGPNVDKILDLLTTDLVGVQALLSTGWSDLRASQIKYYNANSGRLSLTERQALADEIAASSDGVAQADNFAPLGLVKETKKANAALIKYVSSPRTPSDLAGLMAALKSFVDNVTPLMQAINTIRTIK